MRYEECHNLVKSKYDMFIKNRLFILFVDLLFHAVSASLTVLDKGVMPLEKNSIAIQFYVDIENKNRTGACRFYTRLRRCLLGPCKEDCQVMFYSCETFDKIKPRDRKTIVYVFPTPYLHDLVGVCDVVLAYRCPKRRGRLIIKIPFDTRIDGKSAFLLEKYVSGDQGYICETIDQNSLDECLPADCDLKYCGTRPFYSSDIKRCVAAAVCVGNPDKKLPNVVYEPNTNVCVDYQLPLTIQDIYAISTGLGTVTESTKNDDVVVKLKSNCSTISQNIYLLRDLLYGKLCPYDKGDKIDYGDVCKNAVLRIAICIIGVCAMILSLVCCINTTIWVHRQWADGAVNEFMLKMKCKFRKTKKSREPRYTSETRNALLREVIVKDIPLELRDSVLSICDRMNREVQKKRRYRDSDVGSQISLQRAEIAPLKHSVAENSDDN